MLFVIHTPYHLYQSLKFLGTKSKRFIFVLYLSERVLQTYSPLIKLLSQGHKVVVLKRSSSRLARLIKNRFDVQKIKGALDELVYNELAVFHDGQLITQAVMEYSLARYGNSFKIRLIEDGSATYVLSGRHAERTASLFLLLKRLWWGVGFDPSSYHGFSDEIKSVYLSHPELYKVIGREVLQRPLCKIESRYLEWIPTPCKPNSILILIDYSISTSYTERYLNVLKIHIEALLAENKQIYVKFHPAEDDFHLMDVFRERVKVLPSEISAEFLVEKSSDKNLKIVGNSSSSLLSLSKEWSVYCTFIDLDEKIEKLYRSCSYIKEYSESELQD